MNKHRIIALAILVTVFYVQPSIAEQLQLGVYVPRLPFADNEARAQWSETLARSLESQTGLSIDARAFTRSTDLSAFIDAGRVQIVLADPVFLAEQVPEFEVIGAGSGPEGINPTYAVMVRPDSEALGIRPLRGRPVALIDGGRLEVALLSNLAFEGLIDVGAWFGEMHWTHDVNEAIRQVKTRRSDAMLGYASAGSKAGLREAATLHGIPLPMLAVLRREVQPESLKLLTAAIHRAPITLPAAGPMNRITKPRARLFMTLRESTGRPPGRPQAKAPIWAPAPPREYDRSYRINRRKQIPLKPALRRWKRPAFPSTTPGPTTAPPKRTPSL